MVAASVGISGIMFLILPFGMHVLGVLFRIFLNRFSALWTSVGDRRSLNLFSVSVLNLAQFAFLKLCPRWVGGSCQYQGRLVAGDGPIRGWCGLARRRMGGC